MRAVDRQKIYLGVCQFLRALEIIAGSANGCAYAQTSMRVFGGVWIFQFLLNVFNCDKALEVVLVVYHQKFFDAMLMKYFFRILECRTDGHGDQVVLRHHFADGNVEASLE